MGKSPKEAAAEVARYLGCHGVHQGPDGEWMPCANHATLERLSNRAEPKAAKKRRRDEWEDLEEGGIIGIETLPGGGLVSERISMAKDFMARRRAMNATRLHEKTAQSEVKSIGMGVLGRRVLFADPAF